MNSLIARLRSFLFRQPELTMVGRNDPCPCGSGKKFKHCCIDKIGHEKLAKMSATASQQPFGGRTSPANRALARMKGRRKSK